MAWQKRARRNKQAAAPRPAKEFPWSPRKKMPIDGVLEKACKRLLTPSLFQVKEKAAGQTAARGEHTEYDRASTSISD